MSNGLPTTIAPMCDVREAYGASPAQFGELRLPPGQGPHPAVVAIHGGYWRNRYDLAYFGHVCAALTATGFATWNIEYRRVGDPGGGWPGTFRDVAAAARYLVTHADRLGIDPLRVGAIGHSAGGHLACWLAGIARIPAVAPTGSQIAESSIPIRAVISLAGVLDLHQAWELDLSDGAAALLLGGGPDEHPDRYAAASPTTLLPLGVPQLIVHGTADDAVPFAMAQRYVECARAAGDLVTFLPLPGVDHFSIVEPTSDTWSDIAPEIVRTLSL